MLSKVAPGVLIALSIAVTALASHAAPGSKPTPGGTSPAIKVDLDAAEIAKSTKLENVGKDPYGPDDDISLSGSPAHVVITFDGKKPQYGDNSFNEAHLLVYPVAQYRAIFPKQKQAEFDGIITNLKKITTSKSCKGLAALPILPGSDGHEILHAQEKYVDFKQGSGVSFISVYGNGDPPVNAADFFYTYQALSKDGKYYISFFWPIKATGLPKDQPLAKSKAFVNKLDRSKFDPSLDTLDKVVASISVQ